MTPYADGGETGLAIVGEGGSTNALIPYNDGASIRFPNGILFSETATDTVPKIKTTGTSVKVRLGDDSADAPITASDGTFSGAISAPTVSATNGIFNNIYGNFSTATNASGKTPLFNSAAGDGSGLTNLSSTALPSTNLWPSLHLPAEVTAVVGDELQLFTRGVAQANDPYTWPLQWVANVGYPYPRYWDFTPSAGNVGTQTLTLAVLDLAQRTIASATSRVVVVSAVKSPATNVSIFCLGDSLTAGGVWPTEAYRRLTQSGGSPAGHSYTNIQFVGEKPMTSYPTRRYTGIGGATWQTFAGTSWTTHGHVLASASTLDATDVGSVWLDRSNQQWTVVWAVTTGREISTNSSFESLAALPNNWFDWFENWTATSTNWPDHTYVVSGTNSVGMLSDGVNWYTPAVHQVITVQPGSNYIVQGWTKGDGTHSAHYAIYDETHSAYLTDTAKSCGNTSTSWTLWSTNIVAPAGCTSMRFYFVVERVNGAQCYWDDVSIKLATNAVKVSGISSALADASGGRLTHSSGATHTSPVYYAASSTEPYSPLWNAETNGITFSPTLQRSGATNIAAAYILLGWNNTTTDHTTISNTIRSMVTTLRAEQPGALVRLVGIQVPSPSGGLGANYGSSASWEYTAVCARMREINNLYKTIADSADYRDFTRYLDVASQFDSEYNMPTSATAVNTRNATTELRGSNGVHPDTSGYYQIGDVVYRDIIRTFCQ